MASALCASLESFTREKGGTDGFYFTPMKNVIVMRNSLARRMDDADGRLSQRGLYRPSLCVVAQGAKQVTVGDAVFDYAEGTALVVSVELPAFSRVTKAEAKAPYMGMTIELDVGLLREVLEQLETPPRPTPDSLGLFIEEMSDALQDCIVRLARLLETPEAIPVLYPTIMKEIYFWLLTGPNGGEICKIARTESHTRRIADAIFMLRKNFTRQIRIEEMAEAARMSPSSFHHHFKILTSMTPLQFQKQLRLLEARRLMVTDAANVTSAALRVGYESASQFSREYTRMFGVPPKRDSEALKAMVVPL
jgi:AraC-like DNA-binding protein